MKYVSFVILTLVLIFNNHIVQKNKPSGETLQFLTGTDKRLKFIYPDTTGNLFLRKLRKVYHIPELIAGCRNDFERLCLLTSWTSKQWKHNGNNTPSGNDALTILEEAEKGKMFRCVEYSIVLSSVLNSVGIKSRVLAIKTSTCETEKSGAGHVIAEAFLDDQQRWVMADAQFNIVPTLNNLPLNAVELQKSLAEGGNIVFVNSGGPINSVMSKIYTEFVFRYLYYFDIHFDNRTGPVSDNLRIDGKTHLMLVPLKAKNPLVFQITNKIDYCLYTNSTGDFYNIPR